MLTETVMPQVADEPSVAQVDAEHIPDADPAVAPTFEQNDLVWAKIRGFPWWPARVAGTRRTDAEGVRYPVRFFHTAERIELSPMPSTLLPYSSREDLADPTKIKSKAMRTKFEKALLELSKEPTKGADEDPPEPPRPAELEESWRDEGHEYLGRRVARPFEGGLTVVGRITRWLPAGDGEDEPPLFHVDHDDGDEEDLEEYEVVDAFELYKTTPEATKLAQAKARAEAWVAKFVSGPDHDMLDVEKRNVRHGPGVLDKSRIVRQEPMSVAQVHEAVAREGLELLKAEEGKGAGKGSGSTSGFRNVVCVSSQASGNKQSGKRYRAQICVPNGGGTCFLGMFATAEEAALCYARNRHLILPENLLYPSTPREKDNKADIYAHSPSRVLTQQPPPVTCMTPTGLFTHSQQPELFTPSPLVGRCFPSWPPQYISPDERSASAPVEAASDAPGTMSLCPMARVEVIATDDCH